MKQGYVGTLEINESGICREATVLFTHDKGAIQGLKAIAGAYLPIPPEQTADGAFSYQELGVTVKAIGAEAVSEKQYAKMKETVEERVVPAGPGQGDMGPEEDYRVHIFAVVRVPYTVRATSPIAAIEKAEQSADLHADFRSGEYAEEVTGVLLDQLNAQGDVVNYTSYDIEDGEWVVASPEKKVTVPMVPQSSLQATQSALSDAMDYAHQLEQQLHALGIAPVEYKKERAAPVEVQALSSGPSL